MFGLLLWDLFNTLNTNRPSNPHDLGWNIYDYRSGLECGESQKRLVSYCIVEMRGLILQCLRFNPNDRPTAIEAKNTLTRIAAEGIESGGDIGDIEDAEDPVHDDNAENGDGYC